MIHPHSNSTHIITITTLLHYLYSSNELLLRYMTDRFVHHTAITSNRKLPISPRGKRLYYTDKPKVKASVYHSAIIYMYIPIVSMTLPPNSPLRFLDLTTPWIFHGRVCIYLGRLYSLFLFAKADGRYNPFAGVIYGESLLCNGLIDRFGKMRG